MIEQILDAIADLSAIGSPGRTAAQLLRRCPSQCHALWAGGGGQSHGPDRRRMAKTAEYQQRRLQIEQWNVTQPHIRRGIALSPVKFGISFHGDPLQSGRRPGTCLHRWLRVVESRRYGDGAGTVYQVAQVVAQELCLPLAAIRVSTTDTSKVPNTSATAASAGADLNGKARRPRLQTIRERLVLFAVNTSRRLPRTSGSPMARSTSVNNS